MSCWACNCSLSFSSSCATNPQRIGHKKEHLSPTQKRFRRGKTYFRTSDKDRKGMVEKRFALSGASSVSNFISLPEIGDWRSTWEGETFLHHSFAVFVWCSDPHKKHEAVLEEQFWHNKGIKMDTVKPTVVNIWARTAATLTKGFHSDSLTPTRSWVKKARAIFYGFCMNKYGSFAIGILVEWRSGCRTFRAMAQLENNFNNFNR